MTKLNIKNPNLVRLEAELKKRKLVKRKEPKLKVNHVIPPKRKDEKN